MVETRDGYVVDLTYSAQVFAEQAPPSLAVMAELSGVAAPEAEAPRYLELGFGQGLTLNAVAAGNAGVFEGVDFIAEHVEHAAGLAGASGADLTLHGDSFSEFAAKEGEPFDYIVMHGVWSWVDDATRAAIVGILDKRLADGGLCLISYNTPQGWAAIDPMGLLFRRFAAVAEGDTLARMVSAVEFADKLRGAGAGFFAQHPTAAQALERMKKESPRYLAHEYLNEGYRAISHAETADLAAAAGLTYAGPARAGEFLERRRVTAEAQAVLNEIEDPRLSELAREFIQSQRFRSDLFVKGTPRPADPERLAARPFVLTGFVEAVRSAQVGGNEGFQRLALRVGEVLASDGAAPKTLAEIDAACPNATAEQISWALAGLIGAGVVAPAHDAAAAEAAAPATARLNAELCRRACEKMDIQMLACPATGGAISVRGVAQVYLHALAEGVEDVPAFTWEKLKAQGESMTEQGRRLEGDGANVDALRKDFAWFESRGLTRLRRLGVAPA